MKLRQRLRALMPHIRVDGCTAVPDLYYTRCCNRHDLDYSLRIDEAGRPITRRQADARLFRCMSKHPSSTMLHTIFLPAIFWLGVRAFGWLHWRGAAPPHHPNDGGNI